MRVKRSCSYCNHKKLKETFKDEIQLLHPDIILLTSYVNWDTSIKCECAIDGLQWETKPACLFRENYMCKECRKRTGNAKRKTLGTFVQEMKEINPNIEIIDTEYKGAHKLIKCKCKVHNNIWQSYPCNLLNKSASCPICVKHKSKGEMKLEEILQKYNINFVTQHSFDDCKYKHSLRFDAYSANTNIAFEYQGEQHYRPVNFSGDEEIGKQDFQLNQIRDQIKRDYCEDNNINLIEIPYWEYDNMEEYILKALQKINIKIIHNS